MGAMSFDSDRLQHRVEVVTTADGSPTLSVDGGLEHYHSTNGAIAEALHVYINAGLASFHGHTSINVFEVGFGTGLNAMLAFQYAVENRVEVCYTSVERYPLDGSIANQLTYPEQRGLDRHRFFEQLHEASWNRLVRLDEFFTLQKVECNMENYLPASPIDIVFFDAFAPDLQPQLWSAAVFHKLYQVMESGGVLTTYSSKGFVKQNLREVGFFVKRLPGPKGKRHMLLAQK